MEFQFGLITSSGKNLWITIKSITLEKSQFDRTCLISAVQNLISQNPLSQGIYWACPFFSKHQQCIEIVQRLVLRDEKGSFMGLTTSFYIHFAFFVIIITLSHIGNNDEPDINMSCRHKYTARHFIVPVVAYSIVFNLPKFFELTATCPPQPMVNLNLFHSVLFLLLVVGRGSKCCTPDICNFHFRI